MKSNILSYFLLFTFVAATLSSCLDQPKGQYSPSIVCDYIITNNGDTLNLHLDDKQDYYWLDTMSIGDTAQFVFTFWGYANDLISTEIKVDTNYASLSMPLSDEVRVSMLETSDTINGLIYYKPGYNAVMLLADYYTKKSGTPSIYLSVHTNSKYSPTEFEIRTPIR